ncbi:hypothetical protein ACVKN3_002271 [Luteibacter sp. PvP120]
MWGERRAGVRFVAGNARLPALHRIGRLRCVEGSRTCVRSYPPDGRPRVGYATTCTTRGVGAHDVGEKPTKRRRHILTAPRSPSLAARPTRHLNVRKSRRVAPSGPVAAGEGFERKKPEGGRPGRPAVSAETGCRIGNLRSKPDPARRAIDKRPRSGPSLAGRRRRGPERATRRLLLERPKAQVPTRCRRRALGRTKSHGQATNPKNVTSHHGFT